MTTGIILLMVAGTAALPGRAAGDDSTWGRLVYRLYQDHVSVTDGDRCVMFPSCSHYAAESVRKHGVLIGWIMTCDRLVRCGRDEVRLAPRVMVDGIPHTYDPVSANDFWWFETDDSGTDESGQ